MQTATESTESKRENCKTRWAEHKRGRLSDLRRLLKAEERDEEARDLGRLNEYGLSFDYVTPGTFKNKRGYWRYQLSWGGPSDELRYFGDSPRYIDRIEYVFMDWFDGHSRKLRGRDEVTALTVFEWIGEEQAEHVKAQASKE